MAIQPIDLPAAAGIDYSSGDVRHFAQGDAVNVPGLSNPTRNLSERDNKLAEKLNEVVSVVNNQEQFIPLPVVRTTIPPSEEVVVTNYRIPAGFEARVLNATISTLPSSTNAQLDIYYSNTFGGSTGTSVVTATPGAEFTGDVNFYQTGEFILSLKNTGPSTLEIAASVMLTMRPLGAEGTLLVGSIIEGPEGKVGPVGPRGVPGPAGTGGAGSQGMVWRGNWVNATPYLKNDVVAYNYSGTYGSWISQVAHVASLGVNDPQVDPVIWNPVAIGILGAVGATGATGASGTAGSSPTYTDTALNGALVTSSSYAAGAWSAEYSPGVYTTASTVYTLGFREVSVSNSTSTPKGFAVLSTSLRTCFTGSLSIIFPSTASGPPAQVNYITDRIALSVMSHGSVTAYGTSAFSSVGVLNDGGTIVPLVEQTTYANGYGISVNGTDPMAVSITILGAQVIN
jgi:hypothetical protein